MPPVETDHKAVFVELYIPDHMVHKDKEEIMAFKLRVIDIKQKYFPVINDEITNDDQTIRKPRVERNAVELDEVSASIKDDQGNQYKMFRLLWRN